MLLCAGTIALRGRWRLAGGAWFQFGFFGFWDALKNLVAAAAHDQMAAVGERYTAAARADFVVGGFHRCRGIKSPEI